MLPAVMGTWAADRHMMPGRWSSSNAVALTGLVIRTSEPRISRRGPGVGQDFRKAVFRPDFVGRIRGFYPPRWGGPAFMMEPSVKACTLGGELEWAR